MYIKELTAEGGRGHATQHLAANGFCMGRHIRKNMHTIILCYPVEPICPLCVYRKHERIKNSESNTL